MNTSSRLEEPLDSIHLFTIGFTKKDARTFFIGLAEARVKRVLDIRLNNSSQLSGFAKQRDLEYFLHEITGIDYIYLPELAPTKDMLNTYRKRGGDWDAYERQFLQLMAERRVEEHLDPALLDNGCLLCSEPTADRCHRRLVAEYLCDKWSRIHITHL